MRRRSGAGARGARLRCFVLTGCLLAAASACSKPRASEAAPSAAPSASAPPAPLGDTQLDTPTAFELVPSATGATLIWAPASARPGALVAQELDAAGAPRETARALASAAQAGGAVADLSAVWVKHELAVGWVERAGAKARVRALWASTGRVFELGDAWLAPRTARGNLALAARGDAALVFARGAGAACVEPGGRGCFGFSFHELAGDRAAPTGLPLSVPVPCSDNSTVLAVRGGRFHYGVCTVAGERPVTTMFTIQYAPEYARADPLLEGCEPEGTLDWSGAAWLVASCEGRRRAVRLGDEPKSAEYLELSTVRLECAGGAARLRAPAFDLPLAEPRGALQIVLPRELASRGARAVWTGSALLVASTLGDELRLTSTTCNGDAPATRGLDAPFRAGRTKR